MRADKIFSMARREYLARVRSKAFIVTTLLLPAMFAIYALVFPAMTRADVDEVRLTIVDAGTGIGATVASRLEAEEAVPFVVEQLLQVAAADLEEARAELSQSIRERQIDGYLVLQADPETLARSQYYARETGNIIIVETIEGVVEAGILESWFDGDALERLRRVQRSRMQTITVSASGEEAGGFLVAYASTFVLGMLLYMTVLMYGQQMAMAIVEEKSSRLVELVIGAVTSTEYMIGKVLGVLATGLTQLGIWLLMVAVMILGVLPALAIGAAMADFDLAGALDFRTLAYFSIFFFLGYLMYATVFAAIGATCDSVQELQQAMLPAIMPVILAFMSMFYIMTNPSSLAAKALSFFPYFTPLTMFARVNVSQPPLWEIWLSIVVLLATAAATIWAAGKIFHATILFHGKRPGLGELFRMVRAAS